MLGLSGCAQNTQHFITDKSASATVSFDVALEKPFIASISSLSGGQAAMILLVGPFTNTGVLLIAKETSDSGEQIAFRERLKWGSNVFDALLKKNTTYHLVVAVQGTRAGTKEIGTLQVGPEDTRHVVVKLTESEVSLK